MWIFLLQGVGFGLAAASQPGPLQTYLITQSVTRGWKRALPTALAPLVSDGPIILLCVLVLSQVPNWMQRFLYIVGGLFVLYLAYGSYKAWREFHEFQAQPETPAHQGILKAAITNALSPGAYIFWTLVTGPILVRGWREAPINGIGFLLGFYVAMIASLAAIIIIFGVAGKFGNKFNRALLGISTIALFCFGLYQLWIGLF